MTTNCGTPIWIVILGIIFPTGLSNEHFFITNSISEGLLPSCGALRKQYEEDERLSFAPFPPDISGQWISERCEIRPGPEFIARKYEFYKNYTFEMIQFFYGDPNCVLPLYSLIAHGSFDPIGLSWVTPGGLEIDFTLFNVKVTPYTNDVAEELFYRINRTCPDIAQKRHWKPHHQYLIFSYDDDQHDESSNLTDYDCLHGIHAVFNEIQLVRIIKKPGQIISFSPRSKFNMKSYLYLGDIHPVPEGRFSYRPTSYQEPLISVDAAIHCHNCAKIIRSSVQNPPHLHPRSSVSIALKNDWISRGCEVLSYGTFLKRHYTFKTPEVRTNKRKRLTSTWIAEINYFSDPSCLHPIYSTILHGTYAVGRESSVQGFQNLDIITTSTILTPQDLSIVANLNGHSSDVCGKQGSWILGGSQELAKTSGCIGLGIFLPRREKSLIKTERDSRDFGLLYLGVSQVLSDETRYNKPTSIHPPLVNCKKEDIDGNEISPLSYSMPLNTCSKFPTSTIPFTLFVVVLLIINH